MAVHQQVLEMDSSHRFGFENKKHLTIWIGELGHIPVNYRTERSVLTIIGIS